MRAAVAACGGTITSGDRRPIPHLRYWLDTDPGTVSTTTAGASPLQPVLLLPRDTRRMRRQYPSWFPRTPAPAGYRLVYRNRSWRVLAAPRCVRS